MDRMLDLALQGCEELFAIQRRALDLPVAGDGA
jgi:ribonuclease PH